MDLENLDVEIGFPVANPVSGRDEMKGEIYYQYLNDTERPESELLTMMIEYSKTIAPIFSIPKPTLPTENFGQQSGFLST